MLIDTWAVLDHARHERSHESGNRKVCINGQLAEPPMVLSVEVDRKAFRLIWHGVSFCDLSRW